MQQLLRRLDLIRRRPPPVRERSYLYVFQEDKRFSPPPLLSVFPSLSRSIHSTCNLVEDKLMLNFCARYRNSAKIKRTTVRKGVVSFLKSRDSGTGRVHSVMRTTPSYYHRLLHREHPNIEFLRSKGLSTAKLLSSCPTLLTISLEDQIEPAYDVLKSFFKSDSNTAVAIRNRPKLLLLKNMRPLLTRSFNILHGYGGVPQSDVVRLLTSSPWIISMKEGNLKQLVERLRDEMCFDPSTHKFREALGIITRFTRSQWDCKLHMFKKWGLSEDQVVAGFRQFPKLMNIPAEKINGVMELSVNWLGWEPSTIIVTCPALLVYGLSERFTPRVGVLLTRVSKGLMKKEDITPRVFRLTDKCFVNKYVLPEAPELLSLFPKGARDSDGQSTCKEQCKGTDGQDPWTACQPEVWLLFFFKGN